MKSINERPQTASAAQLNYKYTAEVLISLGVLRDRLKKLNYEIEIQNTVAVIDSYIRLNTDSGEALRAAGAVLKNNL